MRRSNPALHIIVSTLFILNLCFAGRLFAAPPPVPDAAMSGFTSITASDLKTLLKFIASDELEGRNTGSRGLNIAAKFLEAQYTLAGLTPAPGQESMLQTFNLIESRTEENSSVSIIRNKSRADFNIYQDFVVFSRQPANVLRQYDAVFAGFGYKNTDTGYDDFKGLDLSGKIAVVIDSSPELATANRKEPGIRRKLRALRREKAKWTGEAGAAGIIHLDAQLSEKSISRLKRYLARSGQMLADKPAAIPQMLAGKKMAQAILGKKRSIDDLIKAALEKPQSSRFELPHLKIALNLKTQAAPKTSQNVVAYLEGSDPQLKEQVVAFGAHYDHLGTNSEGEIYNGADDDGSGTVGMLEIARAFANNSVRPKRSLLFVSHAGEEKGLLGSTYYTDHPIIPLERTVAQLNIDMIGRNDSNSVYIIGSNYLSQELDRLNRAANREIGLTLDYTYNDLKDPNRFYYRSDHYNYAKHGVPIIFFFSGTHKDYHKPTDTVEKINFQKMQKIARLVYLTAWNVANIDHRLSKDGLLLKETAGE